MRKLKLLLVLALFISGCTKSPTPKTAIKPVTDDYHGTQVVDNYQWLEDWGDETVKAWSDKQNTYARSILDNLPSTNEISERIKEIDRATSVSYGGLGWHGGKLFAMKYDPANEQPVLVVMDSVNQPETEKVILDLNKIDPSRATSIDWFKPAPSGMLVAVSLSIGGSESGDVHIYDTTTGAEVGQPIERVNGGTAGGDLCWTPDSSGVFYTRYPRPGERPLEDLDFFVQVWFHRIGTPLNTDVYEVGRKFTRISEIVLATDIKSSRVLATVQYGDSGRFAYYLRELDGHWSQIAGLGDGVAQGLFGNDDCLYFVSHKDSPRGKILKLDINEPSLDKAQILVPEGEDAIVTSFGGSNILSTDNRLYVTYQLGGPTTVRAFDHSGNEQIAPELLDVSSVRHLVQLEGDDILYSNHSFIEPSAWYVFKNAEKSTTEKTKLFTKSPVDFSDTEVVREFAISKDGTEVPVTIIRLKETKLDGSNPTLLTGYGGYGISQGPRFLGGKRLWIEQGGVYAIANIRGGGEFGDQWHRQGSLTNKQNVFDDFAAVMQHLIDAGYTSSEKLAIQGGSNGGLLMGAMLTQHPDKFRCTVSGAGIYDMLRVELSPNGAFNVPEFGSVTVFKEFQALYAYSPYHNVMENTAFPSVMFSTGANDPRVDPMQSRKMTAALQAATTSQNPVILRTNSNTGHGMGTPRSERINQQTDSYAFIFNELGVDYKPVSGQ